MSSAHLGREKYKFNIPKTRCMGMTVEWWMVILRYLIEGIEQQNQLAIMIKMYETLVEKRERGRMMYTRIKLSSFCQVTQKLLNEFQQWCTTAYQGIIHAKMTHCTTSNRVSREHTAPLKYISHCHLCQMAAVSSWTIISALHPILTLFISATVIVFPWL